MTSRFKKSVPLPVRASSLTTLLAYVTTTLAPSVAAAAEEPPAPAPPTAVVVEGVGRSADGAARTEGGSLSSAGDRSSAVAVGSGPRPRKDGEESSEEDSSGSGAPGAGSASGDGESGAGSASGDGNEAVTLGLPSGDDRSGVTGTAISIPQGSGSLQGMGESFSAQLSTGIATFSVPFSLPKGRGGAQASLGLSYSSGGGNGPAGQGWSVGVPFIARQTDKGLPSYDDRSTFHPNQDTFVFNGGQELVPICVVSGGACSGALTDEAFPSWAEGNQYFRPRVEGSFLRFFWSADHRTWRVQDKSGTTMELGVPADGSGRTDALETHPSRPSEIYRWHLARQFDQHTTGTGAPRNVVVYRYFSDGGQAYVSDIYDTPPAADPAAGLPAYAHHTRLRWEARPDVTESYRSGWRIQSTRRLAGVDVTSKTTMGGLSGARHQVRRYHLSYSPDYHRSLLTSVQVEGRCAPQEQDAPAEGADGALPGTSCPRLPPMRFSYTAVTGYQPSGQTDANRLPGEMPFDGRVRNLSNSPKHSLDEALTDFFDIDSDGLPDVLVTAPGLYSNGHAIFFNGASGVEGFGGPTNIGVTGVLNANAGTIKLSNLNVSPQDYDGDGRVNLLHMPQVKTYAAYDPRKVGAQWMWVGHEITTASGQNSKIDFGKDTRDTQVMDVDYDGLVDVVVSTGTEYQTFFALGRYPGGDGQFGQASLTSATSATISNNPVKTCVPHSATPVYFGDPDVQLADMNGDGITDIVRIRRGDIRYWPGRGNGFWGTGERDDCAAGTFGANRFVTMSDAPFYSDIQGSTLRANDVNGDGLDDLVQVNFDSVDLYINVDGRSWTKRHILDGTPYHAGYANRVRLIDVNGSGTPDLVWGDSGAYKYIDLAGGQQAYLLVGVENGLGKSTQIEYSTSSAEMRAAERLAPCGANVDPWQTAWCSKAPMVSNVVKRVTERDNITIRGRPPAAYVTEYSYRDPVYEGRQREFRGYARAKATRLGDENSPTDVSESVFLLGECLGSDGTPWDGVSLSHACAPPLRWKDNLQEALKGLPVETHATDLGGRALSSTFHEYTVRTLYSGLDGRAVRHAFLSATDTVLYDTAAGLPGRATLSRTGFVDEGKPAAATDTTVTPGVDVADVRRPTIATLPAGAAHLRTRSEVDLFGNALRSIDYGCVDGDACPEASSAGYVRAEETLTKETTPSLLPHASRWMWRTTETRVVGSAHTDARGVSQTVYDAFGQPVEARQHLAGSLALDRAQTGSLPSGGATDGLFTASTTLYDAVGNALRSRGQNGRCAEVDYDPAYALFAVSESLFPSNTGNVADIASACGGTALVSSATYDHGFGVVTLASDLNARETLAAYDGFGRIVALHKPSATATGASTYSAEASVRISYLLPGCEGCAVDSLPVGTRHSIIHTRAQDGASESDTANYLESYAYVDGFGRTLVTLAEADPDDEADGHQYVAGSLLEWDQKSAVSKKYLPFFWDGDPLAFSYSGALSEPYGRQRYDAFGRQLQTYDLDGTITLQSRYHALSTDLYDAADLYPGPHQNSYASERKDGHGRSIQTTERFRDHGSMEERHVRTLYLPTGEPELIARVRAGSDPIVRWMRYDTLGRMVLNVEPNTTRDFSPNLDANPLAMRAWRYQYNFAGDLIGTSDARRCGQNFFYDSVGRILGEDYAPCEAHHAPYTLATSGTDTDNLEVAYFYDLPGSVPAAVRPSGWDPAFPTGRAIAVLDRASASFTEFDGRGRTVRTQTKVARPRAPGAAAPALASRYAPRVYARSFTFDAADREVTATTGVAELRTASNQPKLPEFLAVGGSAAGTSTVTTTYTKRGTVKESGSSYGSLIADIDRTADGLVTKVEYGDLAKTKTAYLYDERRRISSVQTYRGPPDAWTSNASTSAEPTQQLVLQDEDFSYDVVGNPVEIRDWRDPVDWPAGAKPVSKKIQYDDLYRATKIDYVYSTGDDAWKSPFEAENDAVESGNPAEHDRRRALPSPHVSFSKRVLRQTFEYDWVGNTDRTTDNENGFYDRSLGPVTNDFSGEKPYQLKHAELPGARGGEVDAKYDDAGHMIWMDLRRSGPCLPSTATCSQVYDYRWDEVGRLVRARRWDAQSPASIDDPLPAAAPAADLRYAYDAGDQRVVKEAVDAAGERSFTVYLFETLELRRAEFGTEHADTVAADSDYEVSTWTVVPYLLANGVRLARLAYSESGVPSGAEPPNPLMTPAPSLRVFFELGDHLGSTSVVLDKASGELVERSTFEGYGSTESDYRPDRWKNFREDYKFTGKEEDAEVGLVYFGKRYLNAHLGRWISADPLAIHAPGEADLNVYAYVSGSVLQSIDPLGLADEKVGDSAQGANDGTDTQSSVGDRDDSSGDNSPQAESFEKAAAEKKAKEESEAYKEGFVAGLQASSEFWERGDPSLLQSDAGRQAALQACGEVCLQNREAYEKGRGDGINLDTANRSLQAYKQSGYLTGPGRAPRGAPPAPKAQAKPAPNKTPTKCPGGICSCFVAGTTVATVDGFVSIEHLELGDSVLDPHDECRDIDLSEWFEVRYELVGGAVGSIRLLRQWTWIEDHALHSGARERVYLPDVGLDGFAEVRSIKSWGGFWDGKGCPVTGTYSHLDSDLRQLELADGQTLRVTALHRVFSESRDAWVPARDLAPSERLRTLSGGVDVVANSSSRDVNEVVFNIEVWGYHQYYVGTDGVLVHNQECGDAPKPTEPSRRVVKLAPAESKIWKSFRSAGKGRRTSGNGRSQRYYEWDHTHGDIEVYDSKGRHLGSMDPTTGEMYKPPVEGRTIKV